MERLSTRPPTNGDARSERLLEYMAQQLSLIAERERARADFRDEMEPIFREVVDAAIETLGDVEKRGYFTFFGEVLRVVDRVVTQYSADDVRQLGDNVVTIIDTVKNLTQPDVLAMVNEAAEAIHDADEAPPKGLLGMLKGSKDPDVRKGMAVALEVLRQVGRSASGKRPKSAGSPTKPTRSESKQDKLRRLLGPTLADVPAVPQRAPTAPAPTAASKAGAPVDQIPDIDPATWTEAHADKVAAILGMGILSAEQWSVVRFAREDFEQKGKSPNVRRIGIGSGLGVRTVYQLFPVKPGVTVSKLAGIPKPAGCI